MFVRRPLALGVGLALLAPLVAPSAAGAAPTDPPAVRAADWLRSQQLDDGSFELASFPGFETSDAIFALASADQASTLDAPWDAAAAQAVIAGMDASSSRDPLDAIDDLIDDVADPSTVAAGARAAKVAVLVAQPLGIDPTDFDPSDDSETAVDLIARMDVHRQGDGSYDFGAQFNGTLFAAIALAGQGHDVPAALVQQIRDAQRPDGSWDYTGTTTADGEDVDTTSLALIALRSAGIGSDDADVAAAISWLAARQQASGAWQAFGADDPNATAVATLALNDARIDLSTPAWRAAAGSPASGAYVSPQTWLESQTTETGNIASPNDSWGINTFATSQGLQALSRQWFLEDEREQLLEHFAEALNSPAAGPVVPLGSERAILGTNPSQQSLRTFTAAIVLYGQKGREAAAADLFQQAFGRTIDPSGRAYWSGKLATISRPEMLARLTGSSEFYRKAGGTIPTFVDRVYQSVLGRNADPSGRAFWIRKLEGGASVQSVARSLTASAEFRRRQVDAAYDRVLDRQPTLQERTAGADRIATQRVEGLYAELAGSAELYGLLEG